jgi:ferredoxin
MLYIDPENCIDCDCCAPECPVEAIFPDTNVPALWESYTGLNAERAAALKASDKGHVLEKQAPKEGPGCTKRS